MYLGRWRWRGLVAIKHLVNADEQRERAFVREAELLQALRHPNVVSFLGACLEPGRARLGLAVELSSNGVCKTQQQRNLYLCCVKHWCMISASKCMPAVYNDTDVFCEAPL